MSAFRHGLATLALGSCALLSGCATNPAQTSERVRVVAAERVYGDLARQLGGDRVDVTTILDSPSADPHAFEPTARDADAIAAADIVIENGLGYDAFVDKLVAASPRAGRTLVNVGALGGHHTGDNPHVWYEGTSLRTLANVLSSELTRRRGADGVALKRRRDAIVAWTARYARRLDSLGRHHSGARVAISEPVFDYVLHAARIAIATPASFSHAIEEGNDPAPQDVGAMRALLTGRRVAALVYNEQTVEPSTTRLLDLARTARVPVVRVTETLPANEQTQAWIEREVSALDRAL